MTSSSSALRFWIAVTFVACVSAQVVAQPTPTDETICHRAGFEQTADNFHNGVDVNGWFHAPDDQDVAPPVVIRLLEDLALAERALSRGSIVSAECLEDSHIILHGVLQLHPDDAVELGVAELDVAFKPEARGIYGSEYRRELAFYFLGKRFGSQGLIPIVERDVSWNLLSEEVWPLLSSRQHYRLIIHDEDTENPYLHGSVQLWVTGYQPILGSRSTGSDELDWFSLQLGSAPDVDITGDPIWESLSDMFLLDFLIYNADRLREGGSIRLPDGGQRLVLLDNGDTMLSEYPERSEERSRELFESIQRLTPNAYQALSELTREDLDDLWQDQFGEPLASSYHFDNVWSRVEDARERIAGLVEEQGLEALLFAQEARPMASGCFDSE